MTCQLAGQLAATAGRRFLGQRAVLEQDPEAAPDTPSPHCEINPRVACRDKWKRIEALQRLREFFEAYRQACLRFRQGLRDVVFPLGTYGMRVFHGVVCEAPS
jgi:putative transposase